MRFVSIMQGSAGRLARVAVGLALVGIGAWLGGGWWALVAVGLVPLAAGLFNVCLAAPLFGVGLRHVDGAVGPR
jgi:hypothetical protein